MIIQFETQALVEYDDAAHYAQERFGTGTKFVVAVQAALDAISKDPGRYQAVRQDIRIYRLKRYPYYLFYHHDSEADCITIYALAHHKRRQDYWRNRVSA